MDPKNLRPGYADDAKTPSVISAGILIGVGMGGFLDGILLHQILQWHSMLSSVRPPVDMEAMQYNMTFDGLFHAATWLVTALGIARLWRATAHRGTDIRAPAFSGALIFGWGLFNVLEGVVDHQILGLHHVRPGPNQLAWDLGFLAFGAAQLVLGWAMMRSRRRGPVVPTPVASEG